MSSEEVRVDAKSLHRACSEMLVATGVSPEHAEVAAEVLVTTDTWGVFTHGTKLLRDNLKRVRAGGLRTDAQPKRISEGPAWAVIDGNSILGHVTATVAMRTAMEKARFAGIGWVGVRNSCHFGAAGYYAWMAAREGMIGQAMANDVPSLGVLGAHKAVLGTNPFAFAAPCGKHDPILLDMAMSTVAGGKVYAAHQRGEPISRDWLIGLDGRPTTDGALYPNGAFLAPLAGYKGYGLALMNEILAGVLPGAGFGWGVGSWVFDSTSEPTHHGAAFLAIDVSAMMSPEAFHDRMDALVDEIRGVPTNGEPLMMPGQREWEHRHAALQNGILLPSDVLESLRSALEISGVTAPDWLVTGNH